MVDELGELDNVCCTMEGVIRLAIGWAVEGKLGELEIVVFVFSVLLDSEVDWLL